MEKVLVTRNWARFYIELQTDPHMATRKQFVKTM